MYPYCKQNHFWIILSPLHNTNSQTDNITIKYKVLNACDWMQEFLQKAETKLGESKQIKKMKVSIFGIFWNNKHLLPA